MRLFKRGNECPNCHARLEKVPKGKAKCPHCGKPIYVRGGKLFTEYDVNTQDWLARLGCVSVTQKDFDRTREARAKKFGFQPSVNDVVWGILNKIVIAAKDLPPAKCFERCEQAHRVMAQLVASEGKNPNPYIADALRDSLTRMELEGVKKVMVFCGGYQTDGTFSSATCDACKALHRKVFPIEKALAELPVPTVCTSEFGCRCRYEPA